MMNEAVATNESFDLVHHVQPWSYDLPLIRRTEASLVALTEPVHSHVPPPHIPQAAIMALHSTGRSHDGTSMLLLSEYCFTSKK